MRRVTCPRRNENWTARLRSANHCAPGTSNIRNASGEGQREEEHRTGEVALEKEVAEVISAAGVGDYAKRLNTGDMPGFFKVLGDGINNLLEANSRALGDVANVLSRLSHGDLRETISTEYQGLLGKVKDDANTTVENLSEIVTAIKQATDAISTASSPTFR